MLESYEREIRSLEGSLMEAEENLDNTRWASPASPITHHSSLVARGRPRHGLAARRCRERRLERPRRRIRQLRPPSPTHPPTHPHIHSEVWHMQLDSSRNHIILVNLWLSMINISVMATTILPAFFGMNLHSGLPEESMEHFYMVSHAVASPPCIPTAHVCMILPENMEHMYLLRR